MPTKKTAPYWRFWVFGAMYHVAILRDPDSAMKLLDEGVRSVTRDALMDILASYRRVLVDSIPRHLLKDEKDMREYQLQTLDLLEKRYKLGISLGIENAYVLARELAKLHQEGYLCNKKCAQLAHLRILIVHAWRWQSVRISRSLVSHISSSA